MTLLSQPELKQEDQNQKNFFGLLVPLKQGMTLLKATTFSNSFLCHGSCENECFVPEVVIKLGLHIPTVYVLYGLINFILTAILESRNYHFFYYPQMKKVILIGQQLKESEFEFISSLQVLPSDGKLWHYTTQH